MGAPLSCEDPVGLARGIGPVTADKLAAAGVATIADLVWTLPVAWDDLRTPVGVAEAIDRAAACSQSREPPPRLCVRGVVKSATLVPMRGRRAVRVVVADAGRAASLDAWWFYAAHGVLSLAKPGVACLVVGRVRVREGKRAGMAHPDLLRDEEKARGIRPRYPASGVAPGIVRRAMADALGRTSPLPDPVPRDIAARESMPDAEPLLRAVHGAMLDEAGDRADDPGRSLVSLAHAVEARRALADRLAWVEAFTRVWQRLLAESHWGDARAPVIARDQDVLDRFARALCFDLTAAQRRAIEAVARDLDSTVPMRRLLLGDVGTGKTAVALAAAALCVAAGRQCALLVPTGVLAEQYVDAAAPLAKALCCARVVCVESGMRAAERREAIASIAAGAASVVVGTHALLEEDVTFARLGLVVVDEQQRLGVAQRLTLVKKGQGIRPHLLSLSATPIPRTLALALRGEMATSVLDERPRGRAAAAAEMRPRSRMDSVVAEVRAACARGERVLFVCPRIEEDDEDDEDKESGVVARAERLSRALSPVRVVVVHGAMRARDRAEAMRALRRGDAQVLVGTTVIEVGIDIPEATLVVIDGAERFGLAQLHQLRGRVGRGERAGRCILLHDDAPSDLARRRLETIVDIRDGAEIARADLALRGAGDLGGTRQSGLAVDFEWLAPDDPPPWIDRIEADARAIVDRDPRLERPEHRALAQAVRRFARQIAVREEAG